MHGERSVYESEWMSLSLVDVELPSGKRFEHHVLRMPCDAAGVVVDDPDRGVLLLWRHRFISDTWGWEVPAGRVDPGETPEAVRRPRDAGGDRLAGRPADEAHVVPPAQRHVRRPLPPVHRVERRPTSASRRTPTRPSASNGCRGPRLRDEIRAGRVSDGLSLTALLWCAAFVAEPVAARGRRPKWTRSGQNSSSKATSPATPVWYELTVRSKKFDRPCTSCSSMKLNGFFEPNSMP